MGVRDRTFWPQCGRLCAMLDAMLRRKFISAPLFSSLLAGVSVLSSPSSAAGLAKQEADSSSTAIPRGISARQLVFPADFGAHPDTRIEWWYLTGALAVEGRAAAPHFGFQLTFFRLRTGVAENHPSRFAASQLVFAHAALSSLADKRLRHDQRAARAGFDIAAAKTGDSHVWVRDWQLQREGPIDSSRYRARLDSSSAGFAFDLQLASSQSTLLQGASGLSRKGPDPAQASHYYSQPQLQTSGQLRLDGQIFEVRGTSWLDHEWSDSLLADDAIGWDWIGFNLDDGSALTAFRLRRADGSAVYAGGSWRPAGRAVRSFAPSEVEFLSGRRWLSPHTQANYPVAWEVQTPVGRFRVDALFDDQELDSRRSTGAVYWEGLSRLRDQQGRLLGHGYLEMTGYVAPLQF